MKYCVTLRQVLHAVTSVLYATLRQVLHAVTSVLYATPTSLVFMFMATNAESYSATFRHDIYSWVPTLSTATARHRHATSSFCDM